MHVFCEIYFFDVAVFLYLSEWGCLNDVQRVSNKLYVFLWNKYYVLTRYKKLLLLLLLFLFLLLVLLFKNP